jgi:hypothetical protein
MSTWLDTETLALLERDPPDKLAPAEVVGFTLVLLKVYGQDTGRLARALQRIADSTDGSAIELAGCAPPCAVKKGLTHADALLGQFELIAADSISVFLDDEVFECASPDYLRQLYAELMQSTEFEPVALRVESIPSSEQGAAFVQQFLGLDDAWRVGPIQAPRKKARIMSHWASKIGGRVRWLEEY